jgi:hypothetical protein
MPPEYRLRADQQAGPRRPGKAVLQGREDDPIASRPSDALDLSLQDLNLPSQRQDLGLELRLIAMTRLDYVEEDADERVDD